MSAAFDPARQPRPATVLLVDDEQVVSEIYRLVLTRAGYHVLLANNGPTALELARTTSPDFIFLDMRMPGMGGLEVLASLGEDVSTRDVPVVMLSNYDDHRLIEQSRTLGAKDYLVKAGTDPLDLVGFVERWAKPAQ
jgi:CheY-like chemotaxis protein